MAGTKNLLNSDPLEVVIEALEKGNGISLRRNYLTVTISHVDVNFITINVAPNPIGGFCPYVEEITFDLNKIDLSSQIPKDMVYSGTWPATFANFSTFMMASYGLLIQAGHWEVFYDSTVIPLDGTTLVDKDLSGERRIYLRPTTAHPLFTTATVIPLFVTALETSIASLSLSVIGDSGTVSVGDPCNMNFIPIGGLAPFTFTLIEGITPSPLSNDNSSLTGTYQFSGQYNFTIEVSDSSGQTARVQIDLNVSLDSFTVLSGAPDGVAGEPYSYQYMSQGGAPPYHVYHVNQLPVGMSISYEGLLTGDPDVGTQSISIVFEDSVGDRFTLIDSIDVAGRDLAIVRSELRSALTDWLELGAGYDISYGLQSHPDGSTWTALGLNTINRLGPIAGAISLDYGFIIKESEQIAMPNIAIAMMAAKGFLSMGGCLFSAIDGVNGIDIRTSDQSDSQLLVTVWIDGDLFSIMTPEGVDVLTDEFALITVQAADGVLSIHRGTTLIDWMFIPEVAGNLLGNAPFTVGRQSNYTEGYQWNGSMSQIMVFNRRLLGDHIAYLSNNGIGVQYWELSDETDYWVTPLALIGTEQQLHVGQTFDQEVVTVGTRPIIHEPILCGGSIPPGMFLDASNLQSWRLQGTPSQAGIYTPLWVAQGEKEVKSVSIQLTVLDP